MAKIPAKTIISEFQTMHAEHWSYVWGSAKKGCVDCSGAFVYSYKLHSLNIYHGSNRIARKYLLMLVPYDQAVRENLIIPGMAAFKARAPGAKNYSLPSGYTKGGEYYNGDLNDYYHIGLVDADTNFVLNAQGSKTGFVRSRITENWSHVGILKDVDYTRDEKETDPMEKAKVTGGALFLRGTPSKDGKVVTRMENGTPVEVLEQRGEWSRVIVMHPEGWCMTKYLEGVE